MRHARRSTVVAVLAFLAGASWLPDSEATPPGTPIAVNLSLSKLPDLKTPATLTITVTSLRDASGALVEVMRTPGVVPRTASFDNRP